MAPDRGIPWEGRRSLPPGHSFTFRGILAGLAVGLVICFSNMYFGLQTGWVSTMTLPASLMGFGLFRMVSRYLSFPFSPVENVLVQTVAGSMAIMPLGCGFVGVLPAMNYLLAPEELGPIRFETWKLIVWSLGLCYFGVVFAVPLRRQVILRERLRFPSGFSTAVLIGVLHGQTPESSPGMKDSPSTGGFASLVPDYSQVPLSPTAGGVASSSQEDGQSRPTSEDEADNAKPQEWAADMRLLLACFVVSGTFTIMTYFFPVLRKIPLFGQVAAQSWLWTLNPSLAYVGQGIIMGPETTLHMGLGAFVGWAILSPLAHHKGWAPGPVDDWETGSKGWIVWVSLAIMLADALVSLSHVCIRSIPPTNAGNTAKAWVESLCSRVGRTSRFGYVTIDPDSDENSSLRPGSRPSSVDGDRRSLLGRRISSSRYGDSHNYTDDDSGGDHDGHDSDHDDHDDAPPDQQVGSRVVWIGLSTSIIVCIASIHVVFGDIMPLYATVLAVAMALLLSVMGVRALGETDLNPVSGISKLAQLFFALVIPASSKASVLINLIGGAVAEAGALQAGELMQDLKTGHLLGAAPSAQFWGQVIGASVGAVVSAFVYQLYTSVYQIPGDLFQVPTGYVWIFTARLVTGKGLPPMCEEWALGAGILFAVTTVVRIVAKDRPWRPLIPGGIAVAVGMYNVPSFTLARAIGGLLSWYWISVAKRPTTPLIVMASGFILGEGTLSIANLVLQSIGVPHT